MNSWSETARTFGLITVELVALFLVISFLVALANRRLGAKRIQSWLAGGRLIGPVKGALLGAMTPFCSCSTLPMLVGMFKAGVPFSTAAAFLIGSPLLNPIILGAVGLLFGWSIMTGYAVAAFGGTLAIAFAWDALGLERFVKRVRVEGAADHEEPWGGLRAEAPGAWRSALLDFKPLVLPLLLGVSVGAAIYGAVPQSFIAGVAGPDNPLAVPVAAVVGIPLYIRTEAALPIGLALTSAGMGLGPVFALIMGGAGASIPEVSMLTAIFKPRLVAAFVASVLAIAIAGGFLIPQFT
ncbi:permease [Allosalinactinospora lopnorensis]|uniref:permease n=1 Tax=Allosalinactinospora lopnorensis TaxID=1352348 RepID=UPI000623C3AE|nr:permease [Allosalinactinospora lopnorensis]